MLAIIKELYHMLGLNWLVVEGHAVYEENPGHVIVEALCVFIIFSLLFQRRFKPQKGVESLSEKEIDQLCEEWHPDPLVPEMTELQKATKIRTIEGASAARCVVDGNEVLNLVSYNFLGLIGNKEIEQACIQTLNKYGVGSCGPRGFYGTVDVHLNLEKKFAQWLNTEEAILYSHGIATTASTIPAFAKGQDIIIADELCHASVKTGIDLARCKVFWFKHNDSADLEKVIKQVESTTTNASSVRKFVVVEGVYQNTGDICNLPEIVSVKEQYRYRLLMDDSMGMGVLGDTGKGTAEHFNIPIEKIEILTANMSNALAAGGGICAGSHVVCDHQRLSGLGYCFSASMPPFLSQAAVSALEILQNKPQLVKSVQTAAKNFRVWVESDNGSYTVSGSPNVPLVFLMPKKSTGDVDKDLVVLQEAVDKMLERGIFVARTSHIPLEKKPAQPALKIAVTAEHNMKDLEEAAAVIKSTLAEVLGKHGLA
eukprot:GFYU01004551.1.p1 GENE.GFYU01004551.1~~GFYU01004551.1.p1  ORF type:complete len:483 (-),score=159.14 GFYU01004551.1:314-1762(-)